jgi:hypothetical protein
MVERYPLLKGGRLVEICFWDNNSLEARTQRVQAGNVLFIRNVQVEFKNGNVQGALRTRRRPDGTADFGHGWKRLNITDPLVVQLLR